MSLYYQHYLIPVLPEFRPEAATLWQFARELIERGHVGDACSLTYSAVAKREAGSRKMVNSLTGETITIRAPSRKVDEPQLLTSVESLQELTRSAEEYDLAVGGVGLPSRPPLRIGYVKDSSWIPMEEPYHLEIRFRSRSHIVRLSKLRSEDDLVRPLDLANLPPPLFDEDCNAEESEGIFVHPEAGAVRIANAGCATFWMECNYGKFLFPRLRGHAIDVLDESLVDLATTTFSTSFVQACSWG